MRLVPLHETLQTAARIAEELAKSVKYLTDRNNEFLREIQILREKLEAANDPESGKLVVEMRKLLRRLKPRGPEIHEPGGVQECRYCGEAESVARDIPHKEDCVVLEYERIVG